jgi:protein TonB
VPATTVDGRKYTARVLDGVSLHKAAAATIVVVGHVMGILAFGELRPSSAHAIDSRPVQIMFVAAAVADEAPAPPLQLEPPRVDLQPPAPIIELAIDSVTANSAISVAVAPTPPTAPVARATAPEWVSEVQYLDPPRPGYPSASRRLREQGLVVLRVLVDERGRAEHIDVHRSSGHVRLDRAAHDAVTRAAFMPYVTNGTARRVYVLVPIEFALSRVSNPHG